MSQQTSKKRNVARPQRASSAQPVQPARPIAPTSSARDEAEQSIAGTATGVSKTPPTRQSEGVRISSVAKDAWHEAQRAERLTQLEAIAPDIQQFIVATACMLLVGVLYLIMPPKLIVGPPWLLLVVECILLAPSTFTVLIQRRHLPYRLAVTLAIGLLFVLTAALIVSVILLIYSLTDPNINLKGPVLLRAGVLLWVGNVLTFAAWYWETDGNGPRARVLLKHEARDFRFPQQDGGNTTGWKPGFLDYLFLAFCFATALSPADTMPLTQRAKLMMMAEAVLSMLIIVLLVARSVNILQ